MTQTQVSPEMIAADAVETAKILNDAVSTDKIVDNAVTLAKMAGITAGEIIQGDASGDPATLGVGTVQGTDTATLFHAGEFLQAGGTGQPNAWKVPLISKYYVSAQQVVTSAGTLTLTHNLGAMPVMVQCRIVCIDAGGDSGYSQNDELMLAVSANDSGNTGISIVPTSTSVVIRYGSSSTGLPTITNKSTGASASAAINKWKLVVRAWV